MCVPVLFPSYLTSTFLNSLSSKPSRILKDSRARFDLRYAAWSMSRSCPLSQWHWLAHKRTFIGSTGAGESPDAKIRRDSVARIYNVILWSHEKINKKAGTILVSNVYSFVVCSKANGFSRIKKGVETFEIRKNERITRDSHGERIERNAARLSIELGRSRTNRQALTFEFNKRI